MAFCDSHLTCIYRPMAPILPALGSLRLSPTYMWLPAAHVLCVWLFDSTPLRHQGALSPWVVPSLASLTYGSLQLISSLLKPLLLNPFRVTQTHTHNPGGNGVQVKPVPYCDETFYVPSPTHLIPVQDCQLCYTDVHYEDNLTTPHSQPNEIDKAETDAYRLCVLFI